RAPDHNWLRCDSGPASLPGREIVSTNPGGYASLHHRLISAGASGAKNCASAKGSKRPRIQDVIKRIEREKQRVTELRQKNRLDEYKRGKRLRKERGSTDKQ